MFGLGLASIFEKDILISNFERRKLAQFPNKIDENFNSNLNDYLVDQFVYRNKFIALNTDINKNVLKIIDDKNVYVVNKNVYEINYPLNESSTTSFVNKMNYITNRYFKNQ